MRKPNWRVVSLYVWMYFVGLTRFYEKTNRHTYIQTNKLTTRQFGFCTTSKLKSHVCLPMPAVEIYNQHGKSTVFRKPNISIFTARATFLDGNIKKHKKSNCWRHKLYVCLAIQGVEIWPKGLNIHGPMPFQRTTNFPCMLTFRRAEWAKGQLASPGI